MEQKKIDRPEWKWYYFIPFTRGRKDYNKDREIWEQQFLNPIQKIRRQEEMVINSVSVLLIAIITSLWSLLPPLTELPSWLEWMKMGMSGFGANNWGNQLMLTIIPTSAGTIYHKFPYMLPNKGLKYGLNILMKIIPVLILIICYWLIHQELKIKALKRIAKQNPKTCL